MAGLRLADGWICRQLSTFRAVNLRWPLQVKPLLAVELCGEAGEERVRAVDAAVLQGGGVAGDPAADRGGAGPDARFETGLANGPGQPVARVAAVLHRVPVLAARPLGLTVQQRRQGGTRHS